MNEADQSKFDSADAAALQSSLDELTALFRRRLLSDRAAVERETHVMDLLEGRFLEGFLHRIRLLLDRLAAETEQEGGNEYGFARSVADELREALHELDVAVIDGAGPFDARLHVAIARETGDVDVPEVGAVASVGLSHRDRTVVPADVVVVMPGDPRTRR